MSRPLELGHIFGRKVADECMLNLTKGVLSAVGLAVVVDIWLMKFALMVCLTF